jgi:hypothetical protein
VVARAHALPAATERGFDVLHLDGHLDTLAPVSGFVRA